jgi:hypothetical protein
MQVLYLRVAYTLVTWRLLCQDEDMENSEGIIKELEKLAF